MPLFVVPCIVSIRQAGVSPLRRRPARPAPAPYWGGLIPSPHAWWWFGWSDSSSSPWDQPKTSNSIFQHTLCRNMHHISAHVIQLTYIFRPTVIHVHNRTTSKWWKTLWELHNTSRPSNNNVHVNNLIKSQHNLYQVRIMRMFTFIFF